MKVKLLTVSHRQPGWVTDGCAEYEKRLPRTWQFAVVEIKPEPRTNDADRERVQQKEAERIKKALPKNALLIALDERGEQPSSERFAEQLQRWQQAGKDLVFVVGGACGLDATLRQEAHAQLSLSRMVMPHGLVRVVLVEQLYRAVTLLEGHPYHK